MTDRKRLSVRAFISLRQIERIEFLARLHGFTEDDLAYVCRKHFNAGLPSLQRDEAKALITALETHDQADTDEEVA